jgi:hypothetical protein
MSHARPGSPQANHLERPCRRATTLSLMLSLLPSLSKNGDVLTRSDHGKDYFVIRQSEYDRMAMLARSVDFECNLVMDEKFAELAEPEIKPVTVTPAIPEIDRAVADSPGGVLGDVKRTDHN